MTHKEEALQILRWDEGLAPSLKEVLWPGILDVFFLSSSVKSFSSNQEKRTFENRWLAQYFNKFPEWSFVAVTGEKVWGYITACPDSHQWWDKLDQPSLSHWKDLYNDYPVHLHINCHPDSRGQGVGGKLLKALESTSQRENKAGIHLITLEGEQNVHFYKKYGYEVVKEVTRPDIGTFLFMGKKLNK